MALDREERIEDDFYRHYDQKENMWVRHAFWTKASQVEFEDGSRLQDVIDKFTSNFLGGCKKIARMITSLGVPAADDSTPDELCTDISLLCGIYYTKGIDGKEFGDEVANVTFTHHIHSTTSSDTTVVNTSPQRIANNGLPDSYQAESSGGCFTRRVTETVNEIVGYDGGYWRDKDDTDPSHPGTTYESDTDDHSRYWVPYTPVYETRTKVYYAPSCGWVNGQVIKMVYTPKANQE